MRAISLNEEHNKHNNFLYGSKYCKTMILYQKLDILKLADIYGFELGKYMHQVHNNKLPFSLYEEYVKLNEIHSHNIRQLKMQCILRRE